MTLRVAFSVGQDGTHPLVETPDLLHDLPQQTVEIADLMPALSAREHPEDPAHVRLLAETESQSEPLLVHRPTMRVIDGAHRLRAAMLRGRTEVQVRFFDGSEEDAFVLAVQLNVRHGLPLSLDERRSAARRIIASHPHWSDRVIADRTGLSSRTVAKVRKWAGEARAVDSRIGLDGKVRPVSSVEGRRNAAALLAANPDISLRELSRQTGLAVGTVRDVRERIGRGQDPIPPRLRGETGREARREKGRQPAPAVDPAAQPSAPARPAREADPAGLDAATVVRKLARDPSLRSTEAGRWLLRMLLSSEMERTQWEEVAEAIPAHCVPLIRAVVLKQCEDWHKLANLVRDKSPQ